MNIIKERGFWARFSVTAWLIIISSIASILALILWAVFPESINWLALNPLNIAAGTYLWTLVTHMFVHGGFFHLFINMFVLFSLGGLSERIIGRKRFLWFYLVSGLAAGALSVALSLAFGNSALGAQIFGSPDVYMVGASGAIFAVAGLFVVLLPRLKFSIIFLPFFSLPAYIMVPLVLFATWGVSALGGLPIGNAAHLGGFIAGIAYGAYLRTKYNRRIEMLQRYFR